MTSLCLSSRVPSNPLTLTFYFIKKMVYRFANNKGNNILYYNLRRGIEWRGRIEWASDILTISGANRDSYNVLTEAY